MLWKSGWGNRLLNCHLPKWKCRRKSFSWPRQALLNYYIIFKLTSYIIMISHKYVNHWDYCDPSFSSPQQTLFNFPLFIIFQINPFIMHSLFVVTSFECRICIRKWTVILWPLTASNVIVKGGQLVMVGLSELSLQWCFRFVV